MEISLQPARPTRIPLTSLVDVVFILLFFFMLASKQLDWRAIDVNLGPSASIHAVPAPTRNRTLLVLPSGELRSGSRTLRIEAFRSELSNDTGASGRVILVPARGTAVQVVVDVLDQLKATGIEVRLGRLGEVS